MFKIPLSFMRRCSTTANLWKKHGVVPDVIDCPPQQLLGVSYGDCKVVLGNELTPTAVKNEPKVTWKFKKGEIFTLCMTDPDAPSRKKPKMREWHHWLLGNIKEDNLKDSCVLSQYIGAGPPECTGLHRYVLLLYLQPESISFTEPKLTNTSPKNREGFSIRKFAEKYKLQGPIAGNFFQAQYDDYVPQLYKQLGLG